MVQLHRARDRIDAAGGKVVLIGMAGPRQAAWFRRKMDIDFPVLADEERESYRAAGAKRGGAAQVIGPTSVLKGIARVATSGQIQGKPVGDVMQLGGLVVVDSAGEVVLERMARNAADTSPIDELLSTLDRAD